MFLLFRHSHFFFHILFGPPFFDNHGEALRPHILTFSTRICWLFSASSCTPQYGGSSRQTEHRQSHKRSYKDKEAICQASWRWKWNSFWEKTDASIPKRPRIDLHHPLWEEATWWCFICLVLLRRAGSKMHKVNGAICGKSPGFEVNFMPSSQGRELRKEKARLALIWSGISWCGSRGSAHPRMAKAGSSWRSNGKSRRKRVLNRAVMVSEEKQTAPVHSHIYFYAE